MKSRVFLDGTKSEQHVVLHCVPQGSILGPLLYITCTNDLFYNVNIHKYTDDSSYDKTVPGVQK